MSSADVTLSGALRFQAARRPRQEAIVEADGRGARVLTYAGLDAAADELAAGLAAIGVGGGDRVVLRLANRTDFVVAMLATLRAGAVIVPTIRQYAPEELSFALADCDARCLVFDDEDAAPIEAAAPAGVRVLRAGSGGDLAALRGEAGWRPPELDPDGDALMFYTSGTTSRPKGVVHSHRSVLAGALVNAEGWRFRPEDRSYVILPLFHCNALFMQLLPALISGATAVLGGRYSASRYLDECRRHGVTHANLTAGAIRSLLAQPERRDDRDQRLRLLSFGLPLHGEEIERAESRLGCPLVMSYGLTETATGGTSSPLHLDPRSGWQSLGLAQHGWAVRIADPDGEELPAGEIGEILLRGPALMDRYWNQPELSAAALRGGWLHTGDLGWVEQDGYVHFHSREKDMLKPKGENVAASEIEQVLEEHPAVSEAAVVGVFDPHHEERVVAVLAGAGCEDEEIGRHCGERLAGFKVPSQLVWVTELPKTSIGKVNKSEVRALVEAREGAGGVR